MKEIKPLTSLRGIFAMWVMSYHLVLVMSLGGGPNWIFAKGYLGVDFFFLLSGFILARQYGEKVGAIGSGKWLRFIFSRAGRLFPLHLLVIAVCVAVAFGSRVPYSPLQVVGESFLVHRWPGVSSSFNAINGPDWSISTEWLSNILFPIFVGLTLRSSFLAIATGVVCLATISVLYSLNDGSLDLTKANSVLPTVRCFAEFGLGMLLYRQRSIGSFRFLPILASGLLMAALISKAPDALTLLPMAGLLLAVGDNSGVLRWALSGRPIYWVGKVSFSIYLVHLPILRVVNQAVIGSGISGLFAQFVTAAATFGATLLVSAMTYNFVEIPGRDKAKVFARALAQRPSTAM